MNALESQLNYPFGDTLPEPGAALEVAPGVLWLRMGLPFALDHINLWLLEEEMQTSAGLQRGWTVVDCGIANQSTRDNWETVFATQLRDLPILRVVVTHCHPDHVGLADWLCARWQAPLWMTAGEYTFARMMSAGLPGVDNVAAMPHFRLHGLTDPEKITSLQKRHNYYQTLVPTVPLTFRRLHDGQSMRMGKHDWRIITGFGHAPEHASLYCEALRVLISGDMVLPRISTNVSVFPVEPESNPVQLYLDSLAAYAGLPDEVLILPSHGKPFHGLHTRIRQLNEHHRDRLAEVLAACEMPRSAVDILPVMFRRPLDTHQLSFALGEALAHLHKLWFDGLVTKQLGADGIIRFRQRKAI